MRSIDSICDVIADPSFDRSQLHEHEYQAVVAELGRMECAAAFARHQLAERTRERDELALRLAVADRLARGVARCAVALGGDDWDDLETKEYACG